MLDLLGGKEAARLFHMDGDLLVGLVGGETGKLSGFLGHSAVGVDRNDNADFGVIVADVEVVDTEAGSGVNAAGTRFQRDVIAHDDERGSVKEGMLRLHVFHLAAGHFADNLILGDAGELKSFFIESVSHDVNFIARLDELVHISRPKADG